jgi:hypothetical protein
MSRQTPLAAELKVLQVLWGALTAAVIAYAGVCFMVTREWGSADPEFARTLYLVIAFTALTTGAASVWWRRSFAMSPGSPLFLFVRESADAPPHEEAVKIAMQRLQTNCVIVWAMSEAVALLGLVLCLLSRDFPAYLPFGTGALLLLHAHRPAAWPVDRILGRTGSAS